MTSISGTSAVLDSSIAATSLTVGDFTIGFDASRIDGTASGLFVQDNASTNAILFDVADPSAIGRTEGTSVFVEAELVLSPEVATVLGAPTLAGTDVGDARVDATLGLGNGGITVESGVTSVLLNLPLIASTTGLIPVDAEGIVPPVNSDYLLGFPITEETDFTISVSDGQPTISGTIEHTGTLTFAPGFPEVTTAGDAAAQVALPSALTVGNFTIGFDPARINGDASGLFVQDNASTDLILFDIATDDLAGDLGNQALIIEGDLLLSPEAADLLGAPNLAGTDIGNARVDAGLGLTREGIVVESGVTSVFFELPLLDELTNLVSLEANNVVAPINDDYQVGFAITDETDLTIGFSEGQPTLSGTIEHSGTLTVIL